MLVQSGGEITITGLLFVDDVGALSYTNYGLQNRINQLEVYCKEWDVKCNLSTSNTVVFITEQN